MSKNNNNILLILLIAFSVYCALIIGETWDHADNLSRGKITLDYLFSFGKLDRDIHIDNITLQFIGLYRISLQNNFHHNIKLK